MEGEGSRRNFLESCMPYLAMISLQLGYAGMITITKISLNRGMNHYVFVVYRHAFATVTIAPFALVLERKVWPKITFYTFIQMFMLGLLGPVIDQNLFYAGLKLTSPTLSSAISNMLPAMTFVIAVICKMEKLDIKKVRCQAKVIGTLTSFAGAMLMILYKGQVIHFFWSQFLHHPRKSVPENITYVDGKKWIKGSIMVVISTLAWASFIILQSTTLRRYSAQLSLTTIVCFLGTLQSIVVTCIMEKPKASVWIIRWDMNLLAAAYGGIISSGIAYYVQGIVMQKRGTVFVTAFNPLMLISVVIMGSFILAEKIYLGGVIGAILIVVGLYLVLWGKYKEHREKEAEIVTEAIKCCTIENGRIKIVMEDVELKVTDMQNGEASKELRVAINAPKS